MVPPAAQDSDSDDEAIPTTFTSKFRIPQPTGMPIPSFTTQQPAGQVLTESSLPLVIPTSFHSLLAEVIDAMINLAVTRALHRASSAQSLTTPQTDPIPQQLLPGTSPTPPLPAPTGLATIAGLQGHQYASQGAMQLPGMGYGLESGGGGSVGSVACGAPNFPGTRQKSPPRTALRGGVGDQFFLAPPHALSGAPYIRGAVSSISGRPFLVPPAKSPFRGPDFCGAPSGSPFLAVPCPGPLVAVPRPGPRFFPM